MATVSQVESLRALLRKEGLGAALPSTPNQSYPPLPTGFAPLDAQLGGGIPRGQITELVGRASSGRTTVVFSLLAEATAGGEIGAYIDVSDSFDPQSARRAGIALERLLWVRGRKVSGGREVSGVRCQVPGEEEVSGVRYRVSGSAGARHAVPLHGSTDGSADQRTNESSLSVHGPRLTIHAPETRHLTPDTFPTPDTRHLTPNTFPTLDTFASTAWQAVNLVASAGGFGVIVLDLGGLSQRKLRPWQSRQWLRLRRAIEHSPTALVLLASEHLASTVSALVLALAREKTQWKGTPGVSLLLEGFSTRAEVVHRRKE